MKIRETLEKLKNDKLKDFSSKLCFTKYEMLGVSIVKLREIAKKFSEDEKKTYLNIDLKDKTFEEIMLYGLILGYSKLSFDEFLIYFYKFLPFIDNWSVCDSVVLSFKMLKDNKELFLSHLDKLFLSKDEFTLRVAFVILLGFYLTDEYIDYVLEKCEQVLSGFYYVNMAKAWLLSVCFIKYKEKTFDFLKVTKIDNFTVNKTISKIRDSLRVSSIDKERVLSLKR